MKLEILVVIAFDFYEAGNISGNCIRIVKYWLISLAMQEFSKVHNLW